MNMNVVTLSVEAIHWDPKDFFEKRNFYKVIRENENDQISNDYYWNTNKYEGVDGFGRKLDLTSLINKPDGYLQGKLSDADDADYYRFNIAEHRILEMVSDKHNHDITVTLDHIPEGCDYDLILYDGDGNQVGIGQDNGNGGKSVTVPNWNLENRAYTVKVLAKDGSPVNDKEYYHLSFQTQQQAKDQALRKQAEEMSKYALSLRQKLHDGQDASEEKQALQQIRENYEAYYKQQMDELHKQQAAEYLPEGETFDESRKTELLSKMASGDELTEQESGLLNIFASAQEIDSAAASAKLKGDISEKIFQQIEQSGISPCPSFGVWIGVDGKAEVEGIEDEAVKKQLEDILNGYSGELLDIYISINASMQGMSREERYIVEAARGIEAFLQKATGGNKSLADITVENGRINGLDSPLDKPLNNPNQYQAYLDYSTDILAIKNYERLHGNSLLEKFGARYTTDGNAIRVA